MAERIGKYELVQRLAVGGMGEVFLANEATDNGPRTVVVKRLLPQFSDDRAFVDMLFDEARIVASLSHPNIAALYAHGVEGKEAYLAMEWVNGKNLGKVLECAFDAPEKFPYAVRCRVIHQIARALGYAHAANGAGGQPLELIHRDVSPANIMLAFDGSVKLIDFGVAKAADRLARTGAGIIKGKYSYMSPEQAQGGDIDARSDVFGLGTVFYETLTLQRLFRRKTNYETLQAVAIDPIAPPSSINPEIPPELDAVVMRALDRNVATRFQSADAFADAITKVMQANGWKASGRDQTNALAELFPAEKKQAGYSSDEPTNIEVAATPEATAIEFATTGRSNLSDCLVKTSPEDTVLGAYCNAVDDLGRARGARQSRGLWKPSEHYATTDFLHVCFEIATMTGGDFRMLGAACCRALLIAEPGRALRACEDAEELAGELVIALRETIAPGTAFVLAAGPTHLRLAFKGVALPMPFYSGFLEQAVQTTLGQTPTVLSEPGKNNKAELIASW